ncbi:MAG: excinuclease ABC subunit UvrC [Rhodospirillaceae bacterium]|nr:MAG: excinuclease ABC subunit UvrC [Rhodospirillaceae bacterium]
MPQTPVRPPTTTGTAAGTTSLTGDPTGEHPEGTSQKADVGEIGRGLSVVTDAVRTLPHRPGVYRMLNGAGEALYVGKAKNLKKRVVAYTRIAQMPARLQRMVTETRALEIIVTHTEAEALLLEINLIKQLKPRYNILLRDDKSFPYIMIPGDHPFPRVMKHRGARTKGNAYFGPFASAGAVNGTLATLQKVFLLRSCSDTVFANRTRPCLLHQIKRCCAPCVGHVDGAAYGKLVAEAREFLEGNSRALQTELARQMDAASAALDYEVAAEFRDRIRALTAVQAHQDINVRDLRETDVIALHRAGGQSCVQVFFFRAGQNFGNRAHFPAHGADEDDGAILEAFIGQFYDSAPAPREILINAPVPNRDLLAEALALRIGHAVTITVPQRGERRKLVDHAVINAREALGRRMAENTAQRSLLEGTAEVFKLAAAPERIEVYDNSHISGTHMVGAMIVAGPGGLMKNAYRKFNIRTADLAPGDDYGAMREVLTRRFARAQKEDPNRDLGQWPDLVLLDGGQGQLNAGLAVLAELGIDDLYIAAIAKGPDRNAGREQFFLPNMPPFTLPPAHPVLYFLQRLRDEAHRFAISTHRAKRSKAIGQSLLDEIAGIGAARKKALLRHFGSAKSVAAAGIADLEAVSGINAATAKKIYDHFHTTD